MKRVGVILTVICICLNSVFVFADSGISVRAELNIKDFYVDIQAEGLTAFSRVSIIAVPENSTAVSVMESQNAAYIEQVEVGNNGVIKRHVAFLKDTKPGKYAIYLTDSGTGKTYTSNAFSYLDSEKIKEGLKAFNSAKNADEMKAALESYAEDIGLDMMEYKDLSEENRKKTAEVFFSLRPSGGYASAEEVHRLFGASTAVVALPLSKNPLAIIEKYAESIGIDISELKKCASNEQDEALRFLQKKAFSVPDDIKDAFPEAIFVGRVNCADTAGKLQKYILTDYAGILNLDLSSYNSLNNPVNVFSSMLGNSISGYEDLKTKFYGAVSVETSAEASGGKKIGGGSIGGGSSGYPASVQTKSDMGKSENRGNPRKIYSYADLSGAEWAAEYIELLTERGVINGDGNGLFRPEASVTRAEFIKMLVAAFDIPRFNEASEFDDVSTDDWYAPYVAAGVKCGIVKGISRESFGAAELISREDLTVMCARSADYTGMSLNNIREGVPSDFESVSDYARDAVGGFYRAGIINGDTDGSFRPRDGATRAEAAKIIAELLLKKEVVK